MKIADYIAVELERRGVTHVFELVGGMITFLLDALHQHTKIKIVSVHHEQAAGFAAEGFGRMTGIPGVAMATSGPGATNLLTAIGSCYFDSVPTVFITGQVNRHEQKGARAIRQLGFQETDIVAMAAPVTKAAWRVNEPEEVPRLLEAAFALACAGRPGPVLLDVAMDVQRAPISHPEAAAPAHAPHHREGPPPAALEPYITELRAALENSERPLILAGGGIAASLAREAFREAVDAWKIPTVFSLLAVDVLPGGHPLRVGLIGSYGNRWANAAVSESDLLLVLGSRLDVRQTGSDTAGFKGRREIFHLDCEPGELDNRIKGCRTQVADLRCFLAQATPALGSLRARPEWCARIDALRHRWPDTAEISPAEGINPNEFCHRLSRHSTAATAFVSDVGQHQMWAAQSLELGAHQRFLTSGGMGAMGFGLPAAVGAAFASRGPVVVIAGDGGFQLNIQELQTVVRNALPLKMVVLNNGSHGMVRQFQDSYFQGRLQSTVLGYSAPSFAAIARAYGIDAAELHDPEDMDRALAACWKNPAAPFLLEVKISPRANVYPKLAFGRPFGEMEPDAKPLEMEGT